MATNPDIFNDEPTQQVQGHTGGGFPPAKGSSTPGDINYAKSSMPVPSPTSTGKGGIAASLKIKNAGSKDAPGLEKTVNLF